MSRVFSLSLVTGGESNRLRFPEKSPTPKQPFLLWRAQQQKTQINHEWGRILLPCFLFIVNEETSKCGEGKAEKAQNVKSNRTDKLTSCLVILHPLLFLNNN